MNWIETQIDTASAGVDALCAMLTDLGIKGFAISDPADFQEFLQNKEGIRYSLPSMPAPAAAGDAWRNGTRFPGAEP